MAAKYKGEEHGYKPRRTATSVCVFEWRSGKERREVFQNTKIKDIRANGCPLPNLLDNILHHNRKICKGDAMTIKELSRLKDLNSEIDLLEEQKDDIEYALRQMPANYATSVTGSLVDAPYTMHTIRIGGVVVGSADMTNYMEKRRELKEIKALIELRQQECFIEYTKLIRFVNGVPDSLMRQILTLRFVNNLPWVQVASSIGGNNTADSVRMCCDRFLKEGETA